MGARCFTGVDYNEYVAESLVRERLRTLRALADEVRLADAARQPRRPWRVVIGAALVALGERLLAGTLRGTAARVR
ncbi:MAG: hypothetical protein HY216_03975 [Candidatus Rokubacteria bacterium]|nr:hypothetical protein [Candidatus Rokubacteria bacterium]